MSIPQCVTVAIRILHHLIEGKQIVPYEGIKQYMGYIIKIMELAIRFQWVSVLKYDDHFRQLQALHSIPWVFESHPLISVELLPLPVDISAGSGSTLTRNHKVADNHFQPSRKKGVPPDFAVAHCLIASLLIYVARRSMVLLAVRVILISNTFND